MRHTILTNHCTAKKRDTKLNIPTVMTKYFAAFWISTRFAPNIQTFWERTQVEDLKKKKIENDNFNQNGRQIVNRCFRILKEEKKKQ